MSRTYAVIGGGIAGASIAYHLSERTDEEIVVFEKGELATETTAKSIAQFGFYGDETQYQMKRYAKRLYNQFFQEAQSPLEYVSAGHLYLTGETETAEELKAAIEAGGDDSLASYANGFERDSVEYLPGDEIYDKVHAPLLDEDRVEGALFRPNVGYMTRPRELTLEFIERAKENGVSIRTETAITDVETESNQVSGIVTDDGERIPVDEVVCAAGPWNKELAESAGVSVPMKHTLAPVLQITPPGQCEYAMPGISHIDSSFSFYSRNNDELLAVYYPGGYDKASEFDLDEIDDAVPSDIRSDALDEMEKLFPVAQGCEVTDEWTGVRSVTPDGNPIVGWTELEGFSIAAFHTSGIQLSPAIGKMIATQLVDGDRGEYYDALSISRFDDHTDYHQ
ncbi:NAD(P)/FAD-dependent oxidoreductase [Natronorubrum sp. FCH18a]|uniref:NAD(P)/FAD-dependent oxidoreductase n=1 Tax=Natronorubrum sp. FCH18a TaxID=3447018 RepID=UPI003F5164B7